MNQTHFTQETPQLLSQISVKDVAITKKLLTMLCNSSEIQMPQMCNTKMRLSELMDTMIQKPKNLFQQCFDLIVDLLRNMDTYQIVSHILDHLEQHQCINVLMLFYKLLQSNSYRKCIIEEGYYTEIIEKFELALQVPNSLYQKLSKLTHNGDFHLNFTKFLLTNYPQVYSKENNEQRGSMPEKSASIIQMDSNASDQNKKFKIPPLKLPQPNSEAIGVQTRSTRRADPYKSYSTCSNRFSHSIDSAIKFTTGSQALHIKTGEGNQSLEEVSIERKKLSAKEELYDLATQMGSYCLTQDLSCLLSKQRRQQLDSLAKLGLNQIPSILKEQPEEQQTESGEQNNDKYRLQKNRICKVWANIVYLIAKDIKQLQYEVCPSSAILNYLCSSSFIKNNNQFKLLHSKKLAPEFDTEVIYNRNNQVCEQIENRFQAKQQSNLEKLLIPEFKIYFMIIDLYITEKIHLKMQNEVLKDTSMDNEESERSIESPHTVVNIPELMIPVRSMIEIKEVVCNYRHTQSHSLQFMNPFLKQMQMRFQFILSNFDMSKNAYYEQEADHLKILDYYLITSNSRIMLPQFLDYMIDILLMIKRQIVDYTSCQISSQRAHHPSQYQSRSAKYDQNFKYKHYSQTISNMFKPIHMFETSPLQDDQKQHQQQLQQLQNTPQYYVQKQVKQTTTAQSKLPFIQQYPSIISNYLSIIGRLQLKAISNESIKLMVQLYMNDTFLEIVKNFSYYIFQELTLNKDEGFELYGMKIILYLESGLLMLQQKQDKELKPIIRNYLTYITSISKYLQKFIESSQFVLNNHTNQPRIQLYRKVFHLLGLYFEMNRANEDLAVFMIRYCYINFIKLYSQSNLNDLREINIKITEYNQHKIQPSSKQDEKSYKHWNIIFMNLFIKCLFQIASNRTDDVSKKFYQYRIVEFLTREIDLEFDVTQIKKKQVSEISTPRSMSESPLSQDLVERVSSKVSDRINPISKLSLNISSLHKQKLEEIAEDNNEKGKKNIKLSQNLLMKVLVPKLDLDGKGSGKTDQGIISQSYSHSPQFNTSAKQLQNLTALFKQSPQDQEQLNHKRGNSMPFKQDIIQAQLSESQRLLLSKNVNTTEKKNDEGSKNKIPKLNLQNCSSHQEQKKESKQSQLKLNLNQSNVTSNNNNINANNQMSEDLFYYSERKLRKLYSDSELHANCLSLLINLLIKPTKGSLDDIYCCQHPIINGKPNILFILHHHLNHHLNEKIIKLILSKLSFIKQYPVGQRLLKLLCTSLFDQSKYSDWQKLASGAYGVIYQCKTGMTEPEYVAIKQMSLPKSIYERCVLYSLFTELACMENFRLNPYVATIYDYGVTATDYVIVMKKYPFSLKEWRSQQKGQLNDNLASYLAIFRDTLQAVKVLHLHNTTHYDIKADNILLEYGPNKLNNEFHVVLTDFGESRIFSNEEDEYCIRSRGTEYIKSPEMLTLTLNSKKEQDTYDRRKKVGTTRSSDVWSLGCLLFEILTGELLFYKNNWSKFFLQVTENEEQLISEDRCQMLGNNFYLIDFLKYVLVRDQKHRPNIDSVLKRFEHVHALLVNNNNYNQPSHISTPSILNMRTFDQLLDEYHKQVYFNEKKQQNLIIQSSLSFLKLTNDLFISTKSYYMANMDKLIQMGITNIISDTSIMKLSETSKFHYLLFSVENITQIASYTKAAQLVPHMLDYLKLVLLHRGKLLIVENHSSYLRASLFLCLSTLVKLNAFETYHIFNNQLLYIDMPYQAEINQLSSYYLTLNNHLHTFPKLQCICGCTTLILKREFNDDKKIHVLQCKCHGNQLCNGGAGLTKGCSNYLKYLRKKFKLNWDSIKWGYVDLDSFLIGPFNRGQIRQESKIQLLLASMGPNHNMVTYASGDQRVYQCRYCSMWIFAYNKGMNEIAVVTNNLVKKIRQGFSSERYKLPNLKSFNLYELK